LSLSIEIDGLEDLLRRVVREELQAHHGTTWLTSRQAADYLSTTVSTVHNLVSRGRLPRHGESGTGLRFTRADLDRYVEARR
jgi:excisionase family DNA binding protein